MALGKTDVLREWWDVTTKIDNPLLDALRLKTDKQILYDLAKSAAEAEQSGTSGDFNDALKYGIGAMSPFGGNGTPNKLMDDPMAPAIRPKPEKHPDWTNPDFGSW